MKYCPCGDNRVIHHPTLPECYTLPQLCEFTDDLVGDPVHSNIELTQAYRKMAMEPDDVPKTAVTTLLGSLEYVQTSFELQKAALTLQRFIGDDRTNV